MSTITGTISVKAEKTVGYVVKGLASIVFLNKLQALLMVGSAITVFFLNGYVLTGGDFSLQSILLFIFSCAIIWLSFKRLTEINDAQEFLEKLKRPIVLIDEVNSLKVNVKNVKSESAEIIQEIIHEYQADKLSLGNIRQLIKKVQNNKTDILGVIDNTTGHFKVLQQGLSVIDAISPTILLTAISPIMLGLTIFHVAF